MPHYYSLSSKKRCQAEPKTAKPSRKFPAKVVISQWGLGLNLGATCYVFGGHVPSCPYKGFCWRISTFNTRTKEFAYDEDNLLSLQNTLQLRWKVVL